jgi:outer membrane receptor protein involved in Fe transport
VADLDLAITDARFQHNAGNGSAIALAPRHTWAGGLSARHPAGWRGGLRFYGVGKRAGTEDYPEPGSLTAEGFTVVNLHMGYRHRRFDVGFDIENLLDTVYRSAQFATVSRLPGEPLVGSSVAPGVCGHGSRSALDDAGAFRGCEDMHFTPGYPLTARLNATLFLD